MRLLLPGLFSLALASCVINAHPEPPPYLSASYGHPPPPERHFPPAPPSPGPLEPPPVPEGETWNEGKLEYRYNAGTDACYDASKKALVAMHFKLGGEDRKAGVMTAKMASLWARCSMVRRNDLTYLTFYFRVHGPHADEGMPEDFAQRCHVIVSELVGEEGRPTDK